MGLQADMNLTTRDPNALQRLLQAVGRTRVGNAVFAATLQPIDQIVHKATKGRTTAGRSLGGLPVVMMTTTGARSGQKRTNPISAFPFEDDLVLVASNYGKGNVPAWAHNLRANPRTTLTHGDTECQAIACELNGDQYERAFAAAVRVFPGFVGYQKKVPGRIPVFLLTAERD